MKAETLAPPSEGAIWSRIVDPETGDLTPAVARKLLEFDFNLRDRRRMEELAEKANSEALSATERQEAETYNRVAHLLALLQSKARLSLRAHEKR